VAAASGIPVVGHVDAGNRLPPAYYHGTAVAGLVAGPPRADGKPVGIAPAAQILDVQVYDDPAAEVGSEDSSPITADNVVAGLDAVLGQLGTLNIKVVTIALALPHDQRIAQRINRLWKLGAVVVAPTGNRPGEEEPSLLPSDYEQHRSGEDVADLVHPADYRHVLAVNASMTGMAPGTDPTTYVLENSRTMLAAPTAEAVSYSVQGGTCVLEAPATSWAAAEVSGVLALLQSYYDEKPAQAVARLLATANGRTDVPNTLVGAGEVQVLEALTRPLEMDGQGNVLSQGTVSDETQVLSVPEDPPDLMASTRRDAVWWGLLGGGLLMLALVLRPVLARRRTPR
jgi:membrane-anchored mycosin MYCP